MWARREGAPRPALRFSRKFDERNRFWTPLILEQGVCLETYLNAPCPKTRRRDML